MDEVMGKKRKNLRSAFKCLGQSQTRCHRIINWQKSVEMKDQRTKFIELQKNKSSSFYSEHGYEHKKWKLFKMATLLLMVELV